MLMTEFTTNVVLDSNTTKQWSVACQAKLDTGAARTSIDTKLSRFLRLKKCGKTKVSNAMGSQRRKLVELTLSWEGNSYMVEASVTDRGELSTPIIIGRDILGE